MHEAKPIKETLADARAAEGDEDYATAAELYQHVLKQDNLNQDAWNRLMIIYRKQKDKKKELAVISDAIRTYEKFYRSKTRTTKNITELSNKLNKAFGFTDRQGNALYVPEPLATWQKRKQLLEKKKATKKK